MPNKMSRKQQCYVNGSLGECTEDTLCPGWNNTMCFGLFPDSGKDNCRPCEPNSEGWISVEYEKNYGICGCFPQPIESLYKHRENFIFLGLALLVYFLFMTGRGQRMRRRII